MNFNNKIEIALSLIVILNVIIISLETVENLYLDYKKLFVIADIVFLAIFTFEFLIRLKLSDSKIKYLASFYGMIDIISILPVYLYYIAYGYVQNTFLLFRVLRLLRIVRILKIFHYNRDALTVLEALKVASSRILLLLYFLSITVITTGTLMYLIEGKENGFENIPISIYWAIVTLTTVGYGDIVPQTLLGKIISSVLMITGYSTLLVVSGIITVGIYKSTLLKKRCDKCHVYNSKDAVYCNKCGNKFVK